MIKVDLVTANKDLDYGCITFTKGKTYVSRNTKNGDLAVRGNEGQWYVIWNHFTSYGKVWRTFRENFAVVGWFLVKNHKTSNRMTIEECLHAAKNTTFSEGTWIVKEDEGKGE